MSLLWGRGYETLICSCPVSTCLPKGLPPPLSFPEPTPVSTLATELPEPVFLSWFSPSNVISSPEDLHIRGLPMRCQERGPQSVGPASSIASALQVGGQAHFRVRRHRDLARHGLIALGRDHDGVLARSQLQVDRSIADKIAVNIYFSVFRRCRKNHGARCCLRRARERRLRRNGLGRRYLYV